MEPLISVIIPVYKVEEYLIKCVESVRAQTYKNIEIILVDDGSPDRCPEICDSLSRTDSRIVVFHKQNGGLSSARNLGLDHAHGDYIAFVDSDDYVSPFYVERLYMRISKDQTDLVVCEYQEVGDAENFSRNRKTVSNDMIVNNDTFLQWETTDYYMFCIIAWNKLFKAETWKKLRFMEGKYSEDNFAFTEYAKTLHTISIICEPLYFYLQRKDSLIHDYSVKNLDSVEARLERSAYYLSNSKRELANNILMRLPGALITAIDRLDMSDQRVKSRYMELYTQYKKMYQLANCRIEPSLYSLRSAVYVWSDRAALFITKLYHYLHEKRQSK